MGLVVVVGLEVVVAAAVVVDAVGVASVVTAGAGGVDEPVVATVVAVAVVVGRFLPHPFPSAHEWPGVAAAAAPSPSAAQAASAAA
ncbi:MAG: hypothetical protein ACJ76I_14430 [Gaiellaceae bacterium]